MAGVLSYRMALANRPKPAPSTGIGDGLVNMLTTLQMAPLYQAQAAEEAAAAEDKRRLMDEQATAQRSAAAAHDASVGKALAETAIKNNELATLEGRPNMLKLMAASRAGVSVPEFDAALSEMTNGAPMVGPAFLSPPIEGVGPSGRTANLQEVIASLYAPAMSTPADKMDFNNLAQARGHYQDQGVLDQAVAAANGGDYMRSSALSAVRGKKEFTPFAAVGNTGTALNQVTGAQPVTNQAMYTLFGDGERAGIRQKDAQAGASKASAAASYASAAKTKQDRAMGARGVLRDTEQGLALINPQTGAVSFVNGPDGKPLTKAATPAKALPTSAANGLLTNVQNLKRAETALKLINGETVGDVSGDPNATGWKGLMPNMLLNRLDPAGVDTRAMIADLGSLVIHDRSGAALTAAEFPRLAPFIPTAYDDPATVRKKLERFVQVYRETLADQSQFYKDSGYNVPDVSGTTPAAPAAPKPATLPPRNARGWSMQVDRNGNRAYVSPDGKQFEEVR